MRTATDRDAVPVLVVMGVSGSGKSTVARLLAERLDWPLLEGDEMHPPANIAKMAAGYRLTDADRGPWLARIRAWIDGQIARGEPAVVTCSALKRAYRDVLRDPRVVFVHLTGTPELLRARLVARRDHFMPAGLLDSQLADLEPPGPDEQAISLDVGAADPPALAEQILAALALASG